MNNMGFNEKRLLFATESGTKTASSAPETKPETTSKKETEENTPQNIDTSDNPGIVSRIMANIRDRTILATRGATNIAQAPWIIVKGATKWTVDDFTAGWKTVGTYIDQGGKTVSGLANEGKNLIAPAITGTRDTVRGQFAELFSKPSWKNIWKKPFYALSAPLSPIWGLGTNSVKSSWNWVKGGTQGGQEIPNVIKRVWQYGWNPLTAISVSTWEAFKQLWGTGPLNATKAIREAIGKVAGGTLQLGNSILTTRVKDPLLFSYGKL